MMHLLYCKSYQ